MTSEIKKNSGNTTKSKHTSADEIKNSTKQQQEIANSIVKIYEKLKTMLQSTVNNKSINKQEIINNLLGISKEIMLISPTLISSFKADPKINSLRNFFKQGAEILEKIPQPTETTEKILLNSLQVAIKEINSLLEKNKSILTKTNSNFTDIFYNLKNLISESMQLWKTLEPSKIINLCIGTTSMLSGMCLGIATEVSEKALLIASPIYPAIGFIHAIDKQLIYPLLKQLSQISMNVGIKLNMASLNNSNTQMYHKIWSNINSILEDLGMITKDTNKTVIDFITNTTESITNLFNNANKKDQQCIKKTKNLSQETKEKAKTALKRIHEQWKNKPTENLSQETKEKAKIALKRINEKWKK